MVYRVLIDWDDDGYASPHADITANVETFGLRHGMLADGDPYRLLNVPADGAITLVNPDRLYSADSVQTAIGAAALLRDHACKILNPLDEIEWEGNAEAPVIDPQAGFARGRIDLSGRLREVYRSERSVAALGEAALTDLIDAAVLAVTGQAGGGHILNVGQRIQSVQFVGPTGDYIDALAIYSGGIAYEGPRGGLTFVSLPAARGAPATLQVAPHQYQLLADRTLSYRRIPLLRNAGRLEEIDVYQSAATTLAAALVTSIPAGGLTYSYAVAASVTAALSVNWPTSAVIQAQLPSTVTAAIVRSGPLVLEVSFVNADPVNAAAISVNFTGTANLTRQVGFVEQKNAASVAIYGERPVVIPPWYTRADFAWGASYMAVASVPVQYTKLAFADPVEAAAVTTGVVIDLLISDADGLPLDQRAIVVGVELEGGGGNAPIKLAHCLTVLDTGAPLSSAVWDAAIWGESIWGG